MTSTDTPSFFARFWLALVVPFRLLFDARFAAAVVTARNPALPAPAPVKAAPEPVAPPAPRVSLTDAAPDAALQLLGLFGIVGVGRIYLGYTNLGIGQLVVGLVTCGLGALIWGIIDAVMILTDKVRDPQGRPLRDGT